MKWIAIYYLVGLVINGAFVVFHAIVTAEEDDELLQGILRLFEFLIRALIWPVIWAVVIYETAKDSAGIGKPRAPVDNDRHQPKE